MVAWKPLEGLSAAKNKIRCLYSMIFCSSDALKIRQFSVTRFAPVRSDDGIYLFNMVVSVIISLLLNSLMNWTNYEDDHSSS